MSLESAFNPAGQSPDYLNRPTAPRRKRSAPFCLRLTEDERARLEREAKGAPLGSYIKAKALGSALPVGVRRTGLAVQDRESLARGLALLGQSQITVNLNHLAYAARIGALPLTPESEAELQETLRAVRDLRALFMRGLGLNPEDRP